MKALSLTQPWATLVAIGAKQIETRSSRTSYRGPLAIHATKGMPDCAMDLCSEEPFLSALREAGIYGPADLPRGCVIATCELYAVAATEVLTSAVTQPPLSERELAFGNYGIDRYGWLLRNVKRLDRPDFCRGYLWLWEWTPPEIAA